MKINFDVMPLTETQLAQEVSYSLPYHYASAMSAYENLRSYSQYFRYDNVKSEILKLNKDTVDVLDVGCGDGRFCFELRNEIKNNQIHYTGIDYSERAIGYAIAFNPYGQFHCISAKDFSINYSGSDQKKYDAIILIESLEHFIPETIPEFLQDIERLLKPNGRLIITVPHANLKLTKKHYQHFTDESLKAVVSDNFDVISIDGYYSKLKWHQFIMDSIENIAHLFYFMRRRINVIKYSTKLSLWYFNKYMLKVDNSKGLGLVMVAKKRG
jgi:SAM-dependent methyltransferase